MSDQPKDDKKKDLTGIFELSKAQPLADDQEKDPFAFQELPPVEKVDDFASLDQLGMVDHPEPPTETAPPQEPQENLAPIEAFPLSETPPSDGIPELGCVDPVVDPPSDSNSAASDSFAFDPEATQPIASSSNEFDASPPMDYLDSLKSYSEKSRETPFATGTHYPFHLLIQGSFDPYARDKLLRFINDNPIGTNSSELDLQIQGGRVLLPRISEYAGIKLIQELRDSGLSFRLTPSPTDEDEIIPEAPSLAIHYSNTNESASSGKAIPILPKDQVDQKVYEIIDTIQMVQFLKAEILEVEKSDLFQELLTRMTTAIKRKASTMGAIALTNVHHKVDPMRLPSQYKLELNATLLKKI